MIFSNDEQLQFEGRVGRYKERKEEEEFISGHDSWIYGVDPMTKSFYWHS